MPCCSAVGCSNNARKKRMCIFPRDPQRRRQWAERVNRLDWTPTHSSYLCQDHFESDQWENKRADGKRKLKPNAVPTIFPRSNSSKNSKKVRKSAQVPELIIEKPEVSDIANSAELFSAGNGLNATNGALEKNRAETRVIEPEVRATVTSAEVPEARSGAPKHPANGKNLKAANGAPEEKGAKTRVGQPEGAPRHPGNGKDLKKLCDGLQETVLALRRKLLERRKLIAKLRRKLECAGDVRKVFGEDQVLALRVKNGRGARWSQRTIEQGLKLEMACGPRGYAALLALNYPLPSARTLRKKRQQMNLNND